VIGNDSDPVERAVVDENNFHHCGIIDDSINALREFRSVSE
jgi:hypothetical protein